MAATYILDGADADMRRAVRYLADHRKYAAKLRAGTPYRDRCRSCGRYYSRDLESPEEYCGARECTKVAQRNAS